MDSTWYYLRYIDSANKRKPFDSEIVNPILPVDFYAGGKEHGENGCTFTFLLYRGSFGYKKLSKVGILAVSACRKLE